MLLLLVSNVLLVLHVSLEGQESVVVIGHVELKSLHVLFDISHGGFKVLQSILYRP